MTIFRQLVSAALAAAMVLATVLVAAPESNFSQRIQGYVHRHMSFARFTVGRFDYFRLKNAEPKNPTAMTFGPDGRLYVAELNGIIHAYSIRKDKFGYKVVFDEIIPLVHQMANRDDLGRIQTDVKGRLVTGIAAAGSSEAPILFVSSSDPRLDLPGIDTNSGVVSRIERDGSSWQRTDLIRGLPRSRIDHAPHGLALDLANNRLFLAQGSNTNMGAPSEYFRDLPEYALAGAIIEIDLAGLGRVPYDLPTLDDEDRPGPNDENDPFGGNGGKNQAILSLDGPVRLYAVGFRNPYDLVLTRTGIYSIDNGSNQDLGGEPKREGPDEPAWNDQVEGGRAVPNALHHVAGRGYYAGHPNPTRASRRNTFNRTIPQSPVVTEDPRQGVFIPPRRNKGALMVFPQTTNGIAAYDPGDEKSSRGEMLVAVSRDQAIHRIRLSSDGTRVLGHRTIIKNLGWFPLDIVTRSAEPNFPASIWVCDHFRNIIHVVEVQDPHTSSWTQAIRDAIEWVRMQLSALVVRGNW